MQQPPEGNYQQPSQPPYPPQQPYSEYPPQQPYSEYPPQQPYPPQYTPPPGYPPQQPGYPPQQPYYPQQPPMQPPKKSKTGLFIGIGVVVLVFFLCVAAVSHGGNSSSSSTTVTKTSNTSNTSANTNSDTTSNSDTTAHHKIGEVVSTDNTWDITVDSATTSQNDPLSQLKSGDTYLLITMTFKNISDKQQTMSSLLGLELHGSDGTKYSQSLTSGGQAPPDGTVATGQLTKGVIAYEVPKSVHSFTLNYSDLGGQLQTWDITV